MLSRRCNLERGHGREADYAESCQIVSLGFGLITHTLIVIYRMYEDESISRMQGTNAMKNLGGGCAVGLQRACPSFMIANMIGVMSRRAALEWNNCQALREARPAPISLSDFVPTQDL